ncbi:MAG: response regulator [Lachnospiraceae bacterium]|nr:response regulator [Lachnospiraceae bacterium]
MLPFQTHVKIFIIEFVCTVLLQIVYAITVYGIEAAGLVSLGLLPVFLISWIALRIDNEEVVIRCLYISAISTLYYMSYALHTQGTLAFMFLAFGVTIALFIRPRFLKEYIAVTSIILILMGIFYQEEISGNTDMRLYLSYLMVYAFANVALLFIIIGVERYQREMEEKNEVAREALEAKSNFLANMSHEIRTPMNAIYGMAELLEERDIGREEKEYIATIKRSSENLLSIINEILDFSKVDSGKMEYIAEPYVLTNMVQDVTTIIGFRIKDKHIKLITEIDERIPRELIGDVVRIRQILINLMNNAVKFTNQGTITLKMGWKPINETEGELQFAVVDTGIGISEENVGKLFTAFGQLDTKKNRNVEGTGLGLAICKRLVDGMHGEIGVRSKLKEGSTFCVSLPQKVYDSRPCEYKANENFLPSNKDHQVNFIAPKAKVLIVDDNKVNLQVAKELMKLFGFDATTVESGKEAIDRVEKHLVTYDVIFMDHMMPFMDGVEATRFIRQLSGEYAQKVPIVALTANAIKGVEQQFIDAGMNDYLSKPIRLEQLATLLRRYIPKKKQFPADISKEELEQILAEEDFSNLKGEEILEHLEGMDVETGIKNCGGSRDVYFDLLQTYASSNLANVLQDYFEKEDMENYAVTAHSIKGASQNIGAHDVAEKAYSLERAGKRGDLNFIWDNHDELMEEYTAILKRLKKIFFGTR